MMSPVAGKFLAIWRCRDNGGLHDLFCQAENKHADQKAGCPELTAVLHAAELGAWQADPACDA
jgi:hypothetical protein